MSMLLGSLPRQIQNQRKNIVDIGAQNIITRLLHSSLLQSHSLLLIAAAADWTQMAHGNQLIQLVGIFFHTNKGFDTKWRHRHDESTKA